jgi:hypothetical protein
MSLLPLQLPPKAVDEFQALWKKTYGTALPRDLAIVRAHQLIALLQLLTDDTARKEHQSAAMPVDSSQGAAGSKDRGDNSPATNVVA